MSRRQYCTFRVGDDVIHIDVQPTPPQGYAVNVTKAEVGGPPRPLHEATIHATVHEAQEFFITMCRKVLDEIEVDRASFQAVNHKLSVLFIHKEKDGETHYVCERTTGTTVFTVKSPQVSFMRWMLLRIEELTADLEAPE